MSITICDHAGFATFPTCADPGLVSWAGTPVVSQTTGNVASLGASVAIVGNVLNINISGHDNANIETLVVTGLKVSASSGAAQGDVVATLSDNASGAIWQAFYAGSTQATGKISAGIGAGASAFTIAVDTSSPCAFTAPSASNPLAIAGSNPENITSATVGGLTLGSQAVSNVNPVTSYNHLANDVVTQATGNCGTLGATLAMGAPATVVLAASYSSAGNATVYPGETNNGADDLYVSEPLGKFGFLPVGTTLTFKIATAGVVFSGLPGVTYSGTGFAGTAVLSSDRTTVTVTITSASTAGQGQVELDPIAYDVASTVPGGTFVEVDLAISGGILANPTSNTNAVVFRGINASAPTPTVYIGENNQPTGLVTLMEAAPGFFQAGTGNNNVIEVCQESVNWTMTLAPSAKVTAGDLLLRNGLVSAPVGTPVVGSLNSNGCWDWTVWAPSTVASTLVIGNSTFTSGPLINVAPGQTPGIVSLEVFTGNNSGVLDRTLVAKVGFAIAAFRNQVAVTALGQPVIPQGAKTKAGAIQVAETANGQLKHYEDICVEVLPRSSTTLLKQDVTLQALTTADLPTVTASGGLLVGPVEVSNTDCSALFNGNTSPSVGLGGILQNLLGSGTNMVSFSFPVLQQSTTGAGKLIIDNMNYIVTADAPTGPVLVNVYGFGQSNTNIDFQATVSNAKIGVAPKLNIAANSALGLNPTSGYTAVTPKTQAVGKYVTWKFTGGKSLAGQRVNILVAKKFGGAWGGPVYLKSAWADANGIVTFAWTSKTAAAVNVRVQWPGTTAFAVSTSKALGAYYK